MRLAYQWAQRPLSAEERCGSAIFPVKRPCPCRRPRGLLRHLCLAAAHGLCSRTRSLHDVAAGAGRKSLWTERPRAPVRPLLSPQDPGTSSHPVEDETGGNRLTSGGRGARGKGQRPRTRAGRGPAAVLPRSRPPAPPRPGLGALARGRGGGGALRPRSGQALWAKHLLGWASLTPCADSGAGEGPSEAGPGPPGRGWGRPTCCARGASRENSLAPQWGGDRDGFWRQLCAGATQRGEGEEGRVGELPQGPLCHHRTPHRGGPTHPPDPSKRSPSQEDPCLSRQPRLNGPRLSVTPGTRRSPLMWLP